MICPNCKKEINHVKVHIENLDTQPYFSGKADINKNGCIISDIYDHDACQDDVCCGPEPDIEFFCPECSYDLTDIIDPGVYF